MRISAWILLTLSVFGFCLSSYKLYERFTHPLKFKEDIIFYSNQTQISPELIASVINVESSFNKNAKSHKSAIGLMQVRLTTANYMCEIFDLEKVCENDLFNANTNIKFGCLYLKYLLNKFENVNTVLAAYNAGETIVRSWLNNKEYSIDNKTLIKIPYKETNNYIEKINKNVKYYKKILKNN